MRATVDPPIVPFAVPVRGQALDAPARLAALHGTGLLDTAPENAFDRITRLACGQLGVPVALVSLVESHRQFFKSHHGLPDDLCDLRETPLSHSMCQYVVNSGAPLAVPDMHTSKFSDNGIVRDYHMRAYLGVPLFFYHQNQFQIIGALCILDTNPRTWTSAEIAFLTDLAAITMESISLHLEVARRKASETQLEILSGELAHRIKNIFAVTGSLVSMLARGNPEHTAFAERVRQRLGALATAHATLVVPGRTAHGVAGNGSGTFHALLLNLLDAYPASQISLHGEDLARATTIDSAAATSLALILHELATNALKYGALSRSSGHLNLTVTPEDEHTLRFTWQETGGPTLTGAPDSGKHGFGSGMIARTARLALGATLTQEWLPSGLTLTLSLPMSQLSR